MKVLPDKFTELVLYIAKVCSDDPTFGATKLNKILFFSDFFAYRRRREGITGAVYQKLDYGPAPKCLIPAQKALIREGRLAIQEIDRYGRTQKRPVALREPELGAFGADEIAIVNEVIKALWGVSATDTSELSHGFWWHVARMKEEIPIEVSLVEIPDEISDAEFKHARSLEPQAEQLSSAA